MTAIPLTPHKLCAHLLASAGDEQAASEHLAEAIGIAEQAVKRSPDDAEAVVDLAYLGYSQDTAETANSPAARRRAGL